MLLLEIAWFKNPSPKNLLNTILCNRVTAGRILSGTSQLTPAGWERVPGVWSWGPPQSSECLTRSQQHGLKFLSRCAHLLSLFYVGHVGKRLESTKCFMFQKNPQTSPLSLAFLVIIYLSSSQTWLRRKSKSPVEFSKQSGLWQLSLGAGGQTALRIVLCFCLSKDPPVGMTGNQAWEQWSYPGTNLSHWGPIQPSPIRNSSTSWWVGTKCWSGYLCNYQKMKNFKLMI